MKLPKLLANLGYGSRRQVEALFAAGRVTDAGGTAISVDTDLPHRALRVDGEALDPPQGVLLMLHKPVGYTCSTRDQGLLVYHLLPPRFLLRKPVLASVGRLDRDTSGLLLLTDDGALLHRLTSPRRKLPKTYEVTLARDLRGDEAAVFESGRLQLESDPKPLAPASLSVLGPRQARLVITEGRYHQVRRMFAAVGNHVLALHRSSVGGLSLGELPPGAWRELEPSDRSALGEA